MSLQSAPLSPPNFPSDGEETATGVAMGLTRLKLTDFRCYATAELNLDGAKPVVLTGHNGAGKTNLLEAVSYLAPGRGLRGARLGDVTRVGGGDQASWAVAATVFDGKGGVTTIGTGLAPADKAPSVNNDTARSDPQRRRERRVVRVDGEAVGGPSALANRMRLSWITPQMDRLFTEAPSGRRRFLDRLVYGIDPDHARRVGVYERAHRERSKILREYGTGADPAWLDALEHTLAEQGVAIAAARRETVARLRGAVVAGVGPFPGADIAVEGQVEAWLDHMAAVDAEDKLSDHLRGARDADSNGAGPHKSDLVVHHRANNMPAEMCSTGEQKALLISIVLAAAGLHAGLGHGSPILLLDEVAAHLDRTRRLALFEELASLRAQVWLTGTDRELFRPLGADAEFFTIEDGQITPDSNGPA